MTWNDNSYITSKTYGATANDDDYSPKNGIVGVQNPYTKQTASCSVNPSDSILRSSSFSKSKEGITVKGESVDQNFTYASVGALEEENVIVIRLKGMNKSEIPISRPVFTKTKITCEVCGKRNETNNRYCTKCGNALF